jgi:glycosyltransferase involved in cell wall biosynthesis
MSTLLVSVIVPVFDTERYLAEALDSILAQPHRPLQVIVVDDASRDGSVRVAESYGDPVRVVKHTHQQGPAQACNDGIAAADGEFLAFLDADDLWHPDKLERQLEHFVRRDDLDCSSTHIQNFVSPECEGAKDLDPDLLRPMPGGLVTLLLRRRVLDAVGLLDPQFRHTYSTQWLVRARERGVVMETLPDVLVQRRLHLDNMSHSETSDSHDEHLDMVKALLDRRRAAHGVGS